MGSALLALGMLLIPFSATLCAAAAGHGGGRRRLQPADAVAEQPGLAAADAGVQGGTMGLARSATTLARVLGPLFAGVLFDLLGKDWPFFAGALIMVAVMLMATRSPAAAAAEAKP